ncbi:MAG: hypothetical protein NC388_05825 [Clostridium sp.]|nr:hypothetical protein [Clostridium sp.]
MKNNKYIYLFAAALGLTACAGDELAVENEAAQTAGVAGNGGEAIAFASRIVDELEMLDEEGEAVPATRSVITDGQLAGWSKGDVVTVSDGTLTYAYQVKDDTDGATCSFEVVEGGREFTGGAEGTSFYAFYPATAVTGAGGRGGWTGSVVKAMVFAEQKYEENVDGALFGAYMASEPATLKDGMAFFNFHLTASVIDVNLASLGVVPEAVSVKSNSGVSLSGLVKYDCAGGSLSVSSTDKTDYAASTQSDVVTVGGIPADARTVRLYVLPVVLEGGVTITVKATDGTYYTKTASATVGTPVEGSSISGVDGATACKPYYKKYNFGAASKATRLNNWMATIPGNVPLCQLSVPGAHDAATSGVTLATAKTQSKTISELLAYGVRGFDLRPRYNSNTQSDIELDNLEIFHGSQATGVKFKDAMSTLVQFVRANSTEAVYVKISKENSKLLIEPTDQSSTWRESIRTCLGGYYEFGDVLGRITAGMTLEECRGKLVVTVSNVYGTEAGNNTANEDVVYGGRLSWTDATNGEKTVINHTWSAKVADAYVQDNYNASTSDKQTYVKSTLDLAAGDLSATWYLNWLNIANSPKTYAQTVNPATQLLLNACTGRAGFIFYDYCGDSSCGGDALNAAIIDQNFKYVFNNRSRIHMPASTGTTVDGSEMADGSEVYSVDWR